MNAFREVSTTCLFVGIAAIATIASHQGKDVSHPVTPLY